MPSVTVSGGAGGAAPVENPRLAHQVAVSIAEALVVECFHRYRVLEEEHRRINTADSARALDEAIRAWNDASWQRDAAVKALMATHA